MRAKNSQKLIPNSWLDFAKLIKLPAPDGEGEVEFNPYRFQYLITEGVKKLIQDRNWDTNQYLLVANKFRQCGATTSILSFFLWRAAKSSSHRAVAIFPSREDASNMSRRVRDMVDSIPPEYELIRSSNSLNFMGLLGRGSIGFRSTSARSQSLDGFLGDELAFQKNAADTFQGTIPALSAFPQSAAAYAITTPNGKNNFFYRLLAETSQEVGTPEDIGWDVAHGKLYSEDYPGFYWTTKDQAIAVYISHQAIPKYSHFSYDEFISYAQEKFKLTEIQALTEFGLTFQSSDSEVFTSEIISRCVGNGLEESQPSEDGVYFASLDTNNGTGNDFAVLLVFKIIDGKKRIVKQWRSNTFSTNQSLFYCRQILSEFNPRKLFIETNAGGKSWANALSESNFNVHECYTTQANKASMVSQLLLDLEQANLQIDSKANAAVITELLTFQRLGSTANGGQRYGAADGSNDDCVMSLAIGNFNIEAELRDNPYFYQTPEEEAEIYPKHLEAQLCSGYEEDDFEY